MFVFFQHLSFGLGFSFTTVDYKVFTKYCTAKKTKCGLINLLNLDPEIHMFRYSSCLLQKSSDSHEFFSDFCEFWKKLSIRFHMKQHNNKVVLSVVLSEICCTSGYFL